MLTSKLFKKVIFNALSFSKSNIHNLSFSVCLVGMILREMKKEEEKIGEKMVARGVWLEGEKGRENGGTWLFSLWTIKTWSSQIEKKCKRKQVMLLRDALDDIVLPNKFPFFVSLFFYVFMSISSILISFVFLFFGFFFWFNCFGSFGLCLTKKKCPCTIF